MKPTRAFPVETFYRYPGGIPFLGFQEKGKDEKLFTWGHPWKLLSVERLDSPERYAIYGMSSDGVIRRLVILKAGDWILA